MTITLFKIEWHGERHDENGNLLYTRNGTKVIGLKEWDINEAQRIVERDVSVRIKFQKFEVPKFTKVDYSRPIPHFKYVEIPYHVAELENARWYPYGEADPERCNPSGSNGYVVGTVKKGSTTSRLFHVSSTQEWPTGVEKRLDYIPFNRIRFSDDGNGYYESHTC